MKKLRDKAANLPDATSLITGSLSRRIGIAVFVTVLVLDVAVAGLSYFSHKSEFIADQAAEARVLFTAAVDAARYPSIDTLTEVGNNLVRRTRVEGGVIISGAGEDRAVFGTVPTLTWADARIDGQLARFDEPNRVFDVFISPEQTQLPYGLILRLDAAEDWDKLIAHQMEQILLMLVVAAILGLVTAFFVKSQVVKPAGSIKAVVDLALNSLEDVNGRRTGVSRNDEIGALARSVDQLLFLTSTTFTDELAAALSIIDKSPHGIVTLSEQGYMVSANEAALRLFGERSFKGLLERDPSSLFRYGEETVTSVELASRGRILGPGEVLHEGGDFPCLIAGDTVYRDDGSVLRRFLIFVDMRALVNQVRDEVHRREAAEREVARLSGDLRLLRRLFDACLVVAELDGFVDQRTGSVTMQPKTLIDWWKKRLESEGETVPTKLEYEDLPPVQGEPAELRRLFDTALEIVRLRSGAADPHIAVLGTIEKDNTVTLLFRESDEAGMDAAIDSKIDVAILFGALGVLCRRQGGSLDAMTGQADGNRVTVKLTIDADAINAESLTGAANKPEAA